MTFEEMKKAEQIGKPVAEIGCQDGIRFFITPGHAGFNSPMNNRAGYATYAKARRAHLQSALISKLRSKKYFRKIDRLGL